MLNDCSPETEFTFPDSLKTLFKKNQYQWEFKIKQLQEPQPHSQLKQQFDQLVLNKITWVLYFFFLEFHFLPVYREPNTLSENSDYSQVSKNSFTCLAGCQLSLTVNNVVTQK